jgi:hypothetical protein
MLLVQRSKVGKCDGECNRVANVAGVDASPPPNRVTSRANLSESSPAAVKTRCDP